MKKTIVLPIVLVIALALGACAPLAAEEPVVVPEVEEVVEEVQEVVEEVAPQTIVDIAVADGRFMTLATALEAAGLVETLQGAGPFTVFAPTDEAFAKLPAGTIEALLADIPSLSEILL